MQGRNFDLNPPSRIKRQAGVLDATVGGTVTIYDPFGVTAIGKSRSPRLRRLFTPFHIR